MIGSSYLNGYRYATRKSTSPSSYRQPSRSPRVSARKPVSSSRGMPTVAGKASVGWKCPVIIDNMMNLELMFEATKLSGDSTFYNIAVSHANTTMKNHFREDNSCFHVVDYDPETVPCATARRLRATPTPRLGHADKHGHSMATPCAIATPRTPAILTKPRRYTTSSSPTRTFPEDLVPYWDYDAPNIPNEPRDASAAACTASALYELSTYVPDKGYKGNGRQDYGKPRLARLPRSRRHQRQLHPDALRRPAFPTVPKSTCL